MKKIPNIFVRLPDGRITKEVNPVCDWVFRGEGVPHQKYDGTCCMYKDGIFYKRRTVRPNKKTPDVFIKADFDEVTGKSFGWVPIDENDKFHIEAFEMIKHVVRNGTYELIGPKIQGNPERVQGHILIEHKLTPVYIHVNKPPTTGYDDLKEWILNKDIEGLVFHHPDGRMGKIRKTDFGLER